MKNKNLLIIIGVTAAIIGLLLTQTNLLNYKNRQPATTEKVASTKDAGQKDSFLGDKGETLKPDGDFVYIDEPKVSDGNIHAFNLYSENEGKNLYFFVIRASDGSFRVAANACEVCFESQKGFSQMGNKIHCENCLVSYSKDQIGLQKGGCNPRPIDPDAKVIDGKLAIQLADIEATADLF